MSTATETKGIKMTNQQRMNERIRGGEAVTTGEYVEAVCADVTPESLTALAAQLTERTGQEHRVFRSPLGLSVFSRSMGEGMGLEVA